MHVIRLWQHQQILKRAAGVLSSLEGSPLRNWVAAPSYAPRALVDSFSICQNRRELEETRTWTGRRRDRSVSFSSVIARASPKMARF